MNTLFRVLTAGMLAASLTGCSLWGSNDEIEPAELVDFEPERSVEVLWRASVGSGLGDKYHEFVPASDGVHIYANDVEGTVAAFNLNDGREVWETDLDTVIGAGVGAGLSQVVVVAESGEVIALDSASGDELWRYQLSSEAVAAPQLNRELVVVQQVNGKLTALDALTGEHRWTYDSQVPALSLRGTSAPLVVSDVTFAGFANGKFVAVSNSNGKMLWEQLIAEPQGRSELERMVDVDGRPLLANNMLYVTSYQGRVVAINPFNAQIQWAKESSSYRTPAAGFGNIYVVESDDSVQAYDAGSSASVWSQPQLENRRVTAPAMLGNYLVVGDAEGYLHFLSQVDGHFVARYRADSKGLVGDMLAVNDVLYVLGNDGRLLALRLN
ncbi:outer membrane protein assembly factor BamB [Marinobacterium nitratireducens]|uniref:Outer membrane protein assembly factor BamB n=1 Tax=Marinobacterium nitratireducens TaxID=518897 RepID=A0A917ZMY1_9GAMM|nr:outer membrane protein assembly factor BamB [Marinobacterium nitratireducens]GGO85965.1 outer membrane protein assembly factor BamB [Marinobacterium nitratireducens]